MRVGARSRLRRGLAMLGVGVFIVGMAVTQQVNAPAAQALDLPTWDDVQAAKQNQSAADKKVKEIQQLIVEGEKELDRRRNLHSTTIQELKDAEAALAAAADKAATLNEEAATSRKEAEEAADRAGVIVAQMYRSGGVDRSMELFLDADGSTTDALLERMASMSKATERNSKVSEAAEQTANTADSLGKQAKSAEAEREVLRADKKVKEDAAATAVASQSVLVTEQEEQQRDLEIKLEALQDKTTKTVDGYKERLRIEEEQRKAEEERLRKEAEEAERRRKEEEKNNPTPPPPTGPPTGPPTTPPTSSNGWTLPTSGYYVSEGYRSPGRWDHTGIDLATACWTPIVSAASGTVRSAYWDGPGGNMVTVDHSNGWQTRYAHMVKWASVAPGQWVNAGQLLGYVGTTGASTGCHLHFEMIPGQHDGWFGFVNPADYIRF
ncbi:peptidoglycan DD-metalloendopeptidase family protein [Leucobacter salsicius]|uniref:peptidoglycan DD-metalloendopeptidase family protein n=1 Tax=Leucobacter salsicius TaxID=664638 RepID=UPI001E4845E9|nr:peptidoglycan DD-metalloendopeptidase family protein [Leucobacter salsicius]